MSLLLLFPYNRRRGMSEDNRDKLRRQQEQAHRQHMMRLHKEDEEMLILDNNSGSYHG